MTSLMSAGSRALLAVVILGISGAACADDAAARRSVTVVGHGEASGPPDRATINAGIQTLAASVVEASTQNQAILERIMSALGKEGVKEKNIQTADYGVWPEYRHDPAGGGEPTIIGYRVSNTVRITVEDVDKLGKVIAAVTDAGANSIHGIGFGVEDSAALEAEARAAAMADAQSRAEALAGLAGVELGEVLSISMSSGGGYPAAGYGGQMEMARGAPVPGISGGQLSIAVQVRVSYAIR